MSASDNMIPAPAVRSKPLIIRHLPYFLGAAALVALWRVMVEKPWSAVTMSRPLRAATAARMSVMHRSTASMPCTAAGTTPVWPTMSALAKLTTRNSCVPAITPSTTASRTPAAFISGASS